MKTRKTKNPAEYWTDHTGREWKVPVIKDRLRPHQIAGHAALKAHVICRDGGKCRQCGSCDELVVDHVVSKRNGGTHDPDNLRSLCKVCNDAKSNYEDRGRPSPPCEVVDLAGTKCSRTRGHGGHHFPFGALQ